MCRQVPPRVSTSPVSREYPFSSQGDPIPSIPPHAEPVFLIVATFFPVACGAVSHATGMAFPFDLQKICLPFPLNALPILNNGNTLKVPATRHSHPPVKAGRALACNCSSFLRLEVELVFALRTRPRRAPYWVNPLPRNHDVLFCGDGAPQPDQIPAVVKLYSTVRLKFFSLAPSPPEYDIIVTFSKLSIPLFPNLVS